ncbi:MAG: hypothetical protein RR058_08235 [Oscillospiraceae bacterium]
MIQVTVESSCDDIIALKETLAAYLELFGDCSFTEVKQVSEQVQLWNMKGGMKNGGELS